MVGFNAEAKKTLSKREYGVAGAMSGVVTRLCLQPFDVLKIRFQLQVEPISKKNPSSKYSGILQASRCILKEEGVLALWKGHVPAQFLSLVYGVVQFVTFEVLTKYAWILYPQSQKEELKPVFHFFCGGVGGCVATLMSYPFDVVRTRFIAQGEPKLYHSLTHAATIMYHHEGVHSFYRGLWPTLIQIAPYAGGQFAFYNIFTRLLKPWIIHPETKEVSFVGSMVCGSLSGIAAKTMVYPLDLSKKRLQIQGFEEGRKGFGKNTQYHGMVHCLKTIIKEEGVLAVFKGLSPSIMKAMFTTGFSFCIYEQTCQLMLRMKT